MEEERVEVAGVAVRGDAASIATADGEIYLFRGIGTKSDEDALLVTTNTNSDSNNSNNSTNIFEKKMMMTVSKLDLSDIGGKLNELKWQHVARLDLADLPIYRARERDTRRRCLKLTTWCTSSEACPWETRRIT